MASTAFTIETTGLSYGFSELENVLSEVALKVPEGSIYGFLGPNGAGKTTTIKLILGLLKNQRGGISIFGKPFSDHRIDCLKKIGSLVESPSLYAQLSASENLEVFRKIYQTPKVRIPEVLQMVGLSNTGKKKAGQFSLGMKQRLSIGIALLQEPSLLILDEPTNGLDPNGINEIRELLKNLNQQRGITMLISSHLLSEIEKLVTHIGIIHKGRMLFQGTLHELMDKQQAASQIVFETSDTALGMNILRQLQVPATEVQGRIILPALPKEKIAEINRAFVQQNIAVYEISLQKNDLESIFLQLTNA